MLSLVCAAALAGLVAQPRVVLAQVNPVDLDPDKGTLDGSPLDDLPAHIRLLDIRLPEGGTPMRSAAGVLAALGVVLAHVAGRSSTRVTEDG